MYTEKCQTYMTIVCTRAHWQGLEFWCRYADKLNTSFLFLDIYIYTSLQDLEFLICMQKNSSLLNSF